MDVILKLLSENARLKTKDVAVMAGKTEEETRAIMAEYEKAGVIKGYHAIIDWDKTERQLVRAIIEINVSPKRDHGFEEIAERVARFNEVESVYLMSGGYDLAAIVSGKTFQEVAKFVSHKLSPLESVLSTSTHFVLRTYKESGVAFCDDETDERGNASL